MLGPVAQLPLRGGVFPPRSLRYRHFQEVRINSAAWIGVRSSRYGPTIWIPIGSPAEVQVIGLAVAGR
jgi:hypothetical protein